VFGLMNSLEAISGLVAPREASEAIWASFRTVKPRFVQHNYWPNGPWFLSFYLLAGGR